MDIIFIFSITFIIFFIIFNYNKNISSLLFVSFFINWIIFVSKNIFLFNKENYHYIFSFDGCINCKSFTITEGDEIILLWNSISKSLNSFETIFYNSEIFASGFYSSLIAILFKILSNTSFETAIGLNIILTLFSIVYIFKLANIYLDIFYSKIITFIYILYPFFYYYNSVFLRDTIIITLYTISFYYFLISIRENNYKYKFYFLSISLISSFFHIANFAYFFTGLTIYFFLISDLFISKFFKIKIKYFLYLLIILLIIFSMIFVYHINFEEIQNYKIPKLGYLNNLNLEILFNKMNIYKQSSASQPLFLNINDTYQFLYKAPLKFLYFTYAPLPWQIHSITHLIGFIDSLIFLFFTIIIGLNFKKIFFRKEIIFALMLILPIYFTYSIFGSNFGTNMRHRIKFFHVFLFLSSFGITPIILYAGYYFKKIYYYLSEKKNITNN